MLVLFLVLLGNDHVSHFPPEHPGTRVPGIEPALPGIPGYPGPTNTFKPSRSESALTTTHLPSPHTATKTSSMGRHFQDFRTGYSSPAARVFRRSLFQMTEYPSSPLSPRFCTEQPTMQGEGQMINNCPNVTFQNSPSSVSRPMCDNSTNYTPTNSIAPICYRRFGADPHWSAGDESTLSDAPTPFNMSTPPSPASPCRKLPSSLFSRSSLGRSTASPTPLLSSLLLPQV